MPKSKNDSLHQQIVEMYQELPPSELKYYLFIVLKAIQKSDHNKNEELLVAILSVLETLKAINDLTKQPSPTSIQRGIELFQKLNNDVIALKKIANTHGIYHTVKNALLRMIGSINGLIMGSLGLIFGTLTGLVYGIYRDQTLSGILSGFFFGTTLGALFGFRIPNKLFKDSKTRQITFGINGLVDTASHLEREYSLLENKAKPKPLSLYLEEVQREVQGLFANELEYKQFLESETEFRINTFLASFIGQPILHGYAGQHAYITFKIQTKDYLIEFTTEPSDPTEVPSQIEARKVPGSKLIEMLALHRKLAENNAATASFVLRKMKPGDNDCFSYVDKVLLGTNQDGIQLNRYGNLKPLGIWIGETIESLSPFENDFFKDRSSVCP